LLYLILTAEGLKERFIQEAIVAGLSMDDLVFAYNKEELRNRFDDYGQFNFLISFSTNVIVPSEYIRISEQISVNIHSASPNFPGRDPHHYAVYDGAKYYGATLHYMTSKVDEGDIIDVEFFDIENSVKPYELLQMADEAAWKLIRKLFGLIKNNNKLPLSQHRWGVKKRNRKDFEDFCRIDDSMDKLELQRRIKAFHIDGYTNLFTEIHGMKFYLVSDNELRF
jgi:methionyl-tRNA formyltransferase